jgi:hypothetical protein
MVTTFDQNRNATEFVIVDVHGIITCKYYAFAVIKMILLQIVLFKNIFFFNEKKTFQRIHAYSCLMNNK